MKAYVIVCILLMSSILMVNCKRQQDVDDFAEFEFEDEAESHKELKATTRQNEPSRESTTRIADDFADFDENVNEPPNADATNIEDAPQIKPDKQPKEQLKIKQKFNDDILDSEEFESFIDEEEFEGFERQATPAQDEGKHIPNSKADLKINSVPQHLMNTNSWSNYYLEIILCIGLSIYIINIFIGKQKNYQLANAYFHSHRDILEKNFVLIGDDGSSVDMPKDSTLIKECEHIYGIWCSGRQSCKSMYIQLKLLKRQDLISQIKYLFKTKSDQIILNIEFERDDIDNYVFCLSNRKLANHLQQDYQDLANYCVEKKSVDKYGLESSKYVLLNEISEIPNLILDSRVCAFLNKYSDLLDYLIVSDQHVGMKSATQQGQDDQTVQPVNQSTGDVDVGLPNAKSNMILCFSVPGKGAANNENIEKMYPTLLLTFYLIDKISRVRLSKEAKVKAIKKRKEILENYLKISNKQRQEALQLRKEEKRRAEKERIMNESDDEKRKRLEEKELKREKKKQQSKFKQIKIKSM